MLRIWGHRQAPNVRKVLWACAELSLASELLPAGGSHGGTDTPDYRKRNPNGRVPTIDDDGFVLWESHAILRYLASREQSSLYPTGLRARALVEQWLDWQGAHQAPAIRDLVRLTIKTPGPADPQRLAAAVAAANAMFAILDGALGDAPYIAGPAFTIADIPVAVGYQRWATLPSERPAFAALDRWFAAISARPAFSVLLPGAG